MLEHLQRIAENHKELIELLFAGVVMIATVTSTWIALRALKESLVASKRIIQPKLQLEAGRVEVNDAHYGLDFKCPIRIHNVGRGTAFDCVLDFTLRYVREGEPARGGTVHRFPTIAFNPGESWDYDFNFPIVNADLRVNGRLKPGFSIVVKWQDGDGDEYRFKRDYRIYKPRNSSMLLLQSFEEIPWLLRTYYKMCKISIPQ